MANQLTANPPTPTSGTTETKKVPMWQRPNTDTLGFEGLVEGFETENKNETSVSSEPQIEATISKGLDMGSIVFKQAAEVVTSVLPDAKDAGVELWNQFMGMGEFQPAPEAQQFSQPEQPTPIITPEDAQIRQRQQYLAEQIARIPLERFQDLAKAALTSSGGEVNITDVQAEVFQNSSIPSTSTEAMSRIGISDVMITVETRSRQKQNVVDFNKEQNVTTNQAHAIQASMEGGAGVVTSAGGSSVKVNLSSQNVG